MRKSKIIEMPGETNININVNKEKILQLVKQISDEFFENGYLVKIDIQIVSSIEEWEQFQNNYKRS